MSKKAGKNELLLPLRKKKRKLESPLSVTPRRIALVGPGSIEVRLPDAVPSPTQTWDRARSLGNKLLKRFPKASSCQVRVNTNRRDVLWWRRNGRHLEVSVHHALLGWPGEVLAVVAREPGAWPVLQQRLPSAPRPDLPELHARGRVHDLDALLAVERRRLRDAHRNTKEPLSLSGIADVPVTWGRWPVIPPRRTLRLGSCHHDPVLLRVHPVLDDSTVPSWFVGVVLWHELLHVAIPPREQESGRRAVHPPRFRRLERAHPHHELALAWEGRHIERLLARCRERCRSR